MKKWIVAIIVIFITLVILAMLVINYLNILPKKVYEAQDFGFTNIKSKTEKRQERTGGIAFRLVL